MQTQSCVTIEIVVESRYDKICEDTPKPGFKAVEHDLTIVSRRPRSPDVQLRVNILFTNGLAFLT